MLFQVLHGEQRVWAGAYTRIPPGSEHRQADRQLLCPAEGRNLSQTFRHFKAPTAPAHMSQPTLPFGRHVREIACEIRARRWLAQLIEPSPADAGVRNPQGQGIYGPGPLGLSCSKGWREMKEVQVGNLERGGLADAALSGLHQVVVLHFRGLSMRLGLGNFRA